MIKNLNSFRLVSFGEKRPIHKEENKSEPILLMTGGSVLVKFVFPAKFWNDNGAILAAT